MQNVFAQILSVLLTVLAITGVFFLFFSVKNAYEGNHERSAFFGITAFLLSFCDVCLSFPGEHYFDVILSSAVSGTLSLVCISYSVLMEKTLSLIYIFRSLLIKEKDGYFKELH